MDWFYDKQVTFKSTEGEIDSVDGFYNESAAFESLTVDCDLQPVSRDDLVDESGQYIDAQYKIYCDSNSFIKQCETLVYCDDEYEIKHIVDWDDYYIVLIKAVK